MKVDADEIPAQYVTGHVRDLSMLSHPASIPRRPVGPHGTMGSVATSGER
ncbi:hypothetical protein GCM10023347_49260 [Streptomyces chumphonensis]